jgi:hypothetical protein
MKSQISEPSDSEITSLFAPSSETGPDGPELEGKQVGTKRKAARTGSKKPIRRTRTCPPIFDSRLELFVVALI